MENNNFGQRTHRENSTSKITRMSESIIEIKFHLAKLYNAATESRADRQKLKTDQEEIIKKLNLIESNYSDLNDWCNDMQTEIDDISRRIINIC